MDIYLKLTRNRINQIYFQVISNSDCNQTIELGFFVEELLLKRKELIINAGKQSTELVFDVTYVNQNKIGSIIVFEENEAYKLIVFKIPALQVDIPSKSDSVDLQIKKIGDSKIVTKYIEDFNKLIKEICY